MLGFTRVLELVDLLLYIDVVFNEGVPVRPIDAHVHVGRWLTPEFAGRECSVADALSVYLRWNWAGALLFPTDAGESEMLLRQVERLSGPVSFRVGFWAAPANKENLALFERDADRYAALKIHPSFLKIPATDPLLAPYCEIAARLGMPIVVHCGKWLEVAGFDKALDLAARFPVPVILSHMGGDSPSLAFACVDQILARRGENVFLGTESIREPWVLEYAIGRLGASRLVFGSDFNLNHPEPFRRLIEVLDISDSDRDLIMARNINSLLPSQHRF